MDLISIVFMASVISFEFARYHLCPAGFWRNQYLIFGIHIDYIPSFMLSSLCLRPQDYSPILGWASARHGAASPRWGWHLRLQVLT
jgi:hypothetical protein